MFDMWVFVGLALFVVTLVFLAKFGGKLVRAFVQFLDHEASNELGDRDITQNDILCALYKQEGQTAQELFKSIALAKGWGQQDMNGPNRTVLVLCSMSHHYGLVQSKMLAVSGQDDAPALKEVWFLTRPKGWQQAELLDCPAD